MRYRGVGVMVLLAALTSCLFTTGPGRAARDIETASVAPEPLNLPLQELVPGMNWESWYQQHMGSAPDALYFGAYVSVAVEDMLYIGLSPERPAAQSGALIARYDGRVVGLVGSLSEQGVHEMLGAGATLHIAGTDPCCPDGWEAGNHYTYRPPGPLVKHRDPVNGLVKVVHTWGLWMSEEGVLYAAVSLDETQGPAAQLFSSTSGGERWTPLATLGGNRAYDVIGSRGRLYALYNNVGDEPLRLVVSEDGGQQWRPVTEDGLQRARLTLFGERLLAVSADRRYILAVGEDELRRYMLPLGFTLGRVYSDIAAYGDYHLLVVVDDYLYTIWELRQGGIRRTLVVRTRDLLEWEILSDSPQPLISISYWEAQRALILSGQGTGATIWKIELPPPPASRLYLPLIKTP